MLSTLTSLIALQLAVGGEPDGWRRADLQARLVPVDALDLPDPAWRLAGQAIELDGGRRFALAPEDGNPDRMGVDLDGDGALDVWLRGAGDGGVANLRGGDGIGAYPVRLRVAPDDGRWEWAPAGAVRGVLGGTSFGVYDLSGNGRYDDFGVDAMWLGSDRNASYLSRVVQIDGELSEVELSSDGRGLAVRPWLGERGRVDARAGFRSGGELQSAILRSGELVFDLGRARGGALIPAGEYELVHGIVAAGARSVRIAGGAMGPWIVSADRPLVPAWGGPLRASCEAFFEEDVLHVLLFTLSAEGRAGERYADFRPRAGAPRLRVRDVESGRMLGGGEYLSDPRGEWGATLVEVGAGARVQVDLRVDLPLFGPTAVEVLENPRWKRRDLGL